MVTKAKSALGILSISYFWVASPTKAQDGWQIYPPMPTARSDLAAAGSLDGSSIYALGGTNTAGDALNTAEVYNAVTGMWTAVAPMPTGRWSLAAAVGPDDKLYAIGGFRGGNLDTVEVYNPAAGTWSTATRMPTPRSALAVATDLEGNLYAIGGFNPDFGGYLHTVEVYHPATGIWSTAAPMPTARDALAAARGLDGKIYAVGGRSSGIIYATAEVYDPSSDSWSSVHSMTTERRKLAVALGPDNRVYAIGGSNRDIGLLNSVEAYNASTDTWSPVDPLPTARDEMAAATGSRGRIYAVGGHAATQLDNVEVYGQIGGGWSTAVPLDVGREAPAATTGLDGKIYLLGGLRDGRAQSVVEVYNPSSRDWSTIAPMQTARWGLAAATGLDGRIFAIGGFSGGGFLFGVASELQLFDIGLEYVDELDRGEVSDALLDEFRRHDRALGLVYGIEVELTGSRWTIHDVDSQTEFRLWNDGTVLRVYLDFVRELNDLIASHDLRDQFRMHGSPLSPNYEVNVEVINSRWTIHDLDADTYFHVRDEGGTLNVYVDDNILNTVEVYDPSTGQWSYVRRMPFGECFLAAATGQDGLIYAFGGCDRLTDCGTSSPYMLAYNPVNDSWARLAQMRKGRSFLAGVAGSDGRIYAIGGTGLDPDIMSVVIHDSVEAYNPFTDTWSDVPRMAGPRMGLAAAVGSDGTIYAIGGNDRTSMFLDTVETFNPSTGTWGSIAPMPTARRDLAAAASFVLGINRIFAVGGHGAEFPLTTVEVFTP